MKPSVRFSIGKSPFRMTLSIPIEDLITTVVTTVSSAIAREEPQRRLVDEKNPYVLIHDGGEVDVQPCTEKESLDAVEKMLKMIDLKHPKLYRVEGDRRVEVTG